MTRPTIAQELVRYGRKLQTNGLVVGSGGNLSVIDRQRRKIYITPSGLDYAMMKPGDIVICDPEGSVIRGKHRPSSELGFHLALYKKRPEINAVVHTHSVYAATIACLEREIPAVHYLVGFAGPKVPLAPYATFGTPALAQGAADTIGDSNAVLLAHHGLVAVGANLAAAFTVAEEIEFVARIYYQALLVGNPKILTDEQMAEVLIKFKSYGRPQPMMPPE